MKSHLALLRGVNVGGNKKVAMADLRTLVATLGYQEPRTLLQSGNLVFRSDGLRDDVALETLLGEQAAQRLGLRTKFLVRSVPDWAEIIARNPFPEMARTLPNRLLVMFFREQPPARSLEVLRSVMTASERVHPDGRQWYAALPDGIGNSKMAAVLMSARFNDAATGRNWNTVLKLGALVGL